MDHNYINNPFDEFMGCQYERVSDTNIKVTMPIQPLFLNTIGVVHGGIISTLADIAMGNTTKTTGNKQSVVTVDIKTSFLKGATGDFLVADAHLIKKGRTLNHVDCYIYDENNVLVARASGIFANTK
ncbi:PaaI family thioesterase [Cytobacillus suaedae]|nr:PaaI family thioesterase [Cytobacillus suaedae]